MPVKERLNKKYVSDQHPLRSCISRRSLEDETWAFVPALHNAASGYPDSLHLNSFYCATVSFARFLHFFGVAASLSGRLRSSSMSASTNMLAARAYCKTMSSDGTRLLRSKSEISSRKSASCNSIEVLASGGCFEFRAGQDGALCRYIGKARHEQTRNGAIRACF